MLILLCIGIHFAVMALKHRRAAENAPVLFARTIPELKKMAVEVEEYRDADDQEFD